MYMNTLQTLLYLYRTLYCAKGNYEFGVSRIIKSLEPYHKKVSVQTSTYVYAVVMIIALCTVQLGTDTWFYVKRCICSLIENMVGKQL